MLNAEGYIHTCTMLPISPGLLLAIVVVEIFLNIRRLIQDSSSEQLLVSFLPTSKQLKWVTGKGNSLTK